MKKLVIFLLFMVTRFSGAYDHRKCMTWKSKGWRGVIGLSGSTTSFSSSTGECAMIGSVEQKKKVFLAQNHESLKIDAAIGSGLFLISYARLSGCSIESFTKNIRKEYSKIFLSDDLESIYQELERIHCKNGV